MDNFPDLRIDHYKTKDKLRYDLRRFLYDRQYDRSGNIDNRREILRQIKVGAIKPTKLERIALLTEIKNYLEYKLVSGGSIYSVDHLLGVLQAFFNFFNINDKSVTLENIISSYLEFCEDLFYRSHLRNPELSKQTAFAYAQRLSELFGSITGNTGYNKLIRLTRIRFPRRTRKAISPKADKQNLKDTQKMGAFLIDLVSGITIENVMGPFPFFIQMREGLVDKNQIIIAVRKTQIDAYELENKRVKNNFSSSSQLQSRLPVDNVSGTRRMALISRRVVAEFIIFIAQTGMNISTAQSLSRNDLIFRPAGDKWYIKAYKNRRGGEVMFTIYKSYKPHLLKYLKFIEYFLPESQSLFPCLDRSGNLATEKRINFLNLRNFVRKHKIPWIPPITIRKTKANWFLRRTGGDENMTVELMQHVKETLRKNYELPSHQRTVSEITRFWKSNDIINENHLKHSLLSGKCSGIPKSENNIPLSVLKPNCINTSGCLWCKNLRDIDSFDYVWSLFTFRYLKSIEASGIQGIEKVSADIVIERLTEKIMWFNKNSKKQALWVKEAEIRIAEGHYHPTWEAVLNFLEN